MKLLPAILLLCMALEVGAQPWAPAQANFGFIFNANTNTFYVDSSSGNDLNNGLSPSAPFYSGAHALSVAASVPGAVVEFNGSEKFLTAGLTLSAGNITLTSYGSGMALLTNTAAASALEVDNVNNVTVENLRFFGETNWIPTAGNPIATGVWGIEFYNSSAGTTMKNLIVSNCEIACGFQAGLSIESSGNTMWMSNVVAVNNQFHDLNYAAIRSYDDSAPTTGRVYTFTNGTFSGNTISNVYGYEGDAEGYGILITYMEGCVVSNNLIHDNAQNSSGVTHGAAGIEFNWAHNGNIVTNQIYREHSTGGSDGVGIDLDLGATNDVVQRNSVSACDGCGIYGFKNWGNATYRFNTCVGDCLDDSGTAAEMFITGDTQTNLQIYGNTLIAGPNVTALDLDGVVYGASVVANNVMVVSSVAEDLMKVDNSANLSFNGDVFYSLDGASAAAAGIDWQGTSISLADVQGVYSQEVNGQYSNPFLASYSPVASPTGAGIPNFAPVTMTGGCSSPVIGNAVNLSTAYGINNGGFDLLGNSVGASGYNVGAYNAVGPLVGSCPYVLYCGFQDWWTFDNTANDVFGIENGSLVGSPSYSGGIVSNAISLNGTSQYVTAAAAGNFTTGDFTISWWENVSSFSSSPVAIYKGQYQVNGYYVQVTAGSIGFVVNQSGTDQAVGAGVSMNTGQWYLITITRVGSTATIYLDGASVGSGTISSPASSSDNFTIGAYRGTALFTPGSFDDVMLWNRGLGSTEVASLYAAGTGSCW